MSQTNNGSDRVPKVVVVTGSSGSIGAAICGRLAAAGFSIAGLDVAARRMPVRTPPGSDVQLAAYPCDVTVPQDIKSVVPQIEAELGPVDALVNNAGYGGPFHTIDQVSDDEWDQIMAINIRGPFMLCRAVLPGMAARRFGRIVNIASVQGLRGAPRSSTYVASKHALVGLSRSLALEWGDRGITVNAICPGFIRTPMGLNEREAARQNQMSRIPIGRQGEPHEVAGMVAFLLSPEAMYVNGATLTIDGGFSAG